MQRWSGRVAVVSGASSGIGAEISKRLALEGVKVVGLARRKERVEEIASKLPASCKGQILAYKCSVSDEKQVRDAFEWIDKTLGGVSIMINNAGITRSITFDGKGSTEFFREILDTNVLGLSLCTRYALASMRKHNIDDGQFITMNSVCGHVMPNEFMIPFTMYYASKHAVKVLSDGLRKELGSLKTNIRVASVSPGVVKTEILDHRNNTEIKQAIDKSVHLKPDNIADTVVFILAAPPNVNITDVTIQPVGEML